MYRISNFISTPHLLVGNLVRGVLLSSAVADRVDEHFDEMHFVMLRECLSILIVQISSPRDTGSSTHTRTTGGAGVICVSARTHTGFATETAKRLSQTSRRSKPSKRPCLSAFRFP